MTMHMGKLSARKIRWIGIAVLVLSPLAYFASMRLALKFDPNANAGISIDRNGTIAAARRYLASKGFDVTGFESLCKLISSNDNLFYYYPLHPGPDAEIAKKLAPDLSLGALFVSPDGSENLEVLLDKAGVPLGYTRNLSTLRESKDLGEPTARKLAEEALQRRIGTLGISAIPELTLRESSEGGIVTRRYTWKWPLPALEGLTLRSILTIRGSDLTSDIVESEFDRDYPKQKLNANPSMKFVSAILYTLVAAIVLIFGIYRFVQRVKQKEISFSRIAILTGIITFVMSLFIVTADLAIYETSKIPDRPVTKGIILFSAIMAYIVLSLFLGLAYGSGEGDIRESYPGKLASLDAFITGRLLSKNVAFAVISGIALGGWIQLTLSLVDQFWQGKPASGGAYSGLELWFGYWPALAPFALWPMDVLLICVIGLILPLPFLRRRFSSHRIIIPLLALFVWIAATGPYLDFRPWTGRFAEAAIRATFFLLAFFFFDLLTAMITLAASTYFFFAICMTAQPAATLHEGGIIALSAELIVLIAAIIFSF